MDVIGRSVEALVAILVVLFGSIVVKLFRNLIWRPYAFQKTYTGQGIRGPPYRIFVSGVPEYKKLIREAQAQPMQKISHDVVPRIIPQYHKWCQIYGETFFYWYGIQSILFVAEPDLIKEIFSKQFGHYDKPNPMPSILTLVGRGLVFINGLSWANRRRIVAPAFNIDKLKTMVKRMASCTSSMLENWQEMVAQASSDGKEIDVHAEFKALTVDIISHTAFGSSYKEGKEVFELQTELQEMAAKAHRAVVVPGSQYVPSSKNRYAWEIDRRVKEIFNSLIQSRLESRTHLGYGNDLLGIMMTANKKELGGNRRNLSITIDEIRVECKTFFFAGHDTTSNLLSWTVLLLAINPEWQEILRKEVISICGTEIPDADMLSRMISMTMVLNESLRLYPGAPLMSRTTNKEIKLNDFLLPKGATLVIPILAVHHNEKFWGPDAKVFKPERFAEGASKAATHPNAFFPFSLGPRTCIGQTFAMFQAKTVLAMILQKMSFRLSPAYKHAPTTKINLQPGYGMPIIFKNIEVQT